MLVLRRKVGERIEIGGGISVCVVEVDGGRVKLGISAPPGVSIVRKELLPDQKQPSEDKEMRSA